VEKERLATEEAVAAKRAEATRIIQEREREPSMNDSWERTDFWKSSDDNNRKRRHLLPTVRRGRWRMQWPWI
jgi:hypothetical protein